MKWSLIAVASILVIAPILTNPSEHAHLHKLVSVLADIKREHAAACPDCEPAVNEADIRDAVTSRWGPDGIYPGEGLRRRNFLFFSVLTDDGLAEGRTFGAFGHVFGPKIVTPFPCPADYELTLPERPSIDEVSEQKTIRLHIDGTIEFEGKALTRDELSQRLTQLAAASPIAVLLETNGEIKHKDLIELVDLASQCGVEQIQISVAE